MSNQLQYIRRCNLLVSKANGDGLDLGSLRVVFKIKKSDAQTPNTAEIRVYNLSENTAKQIQKEFTQVTLQAGYESNYGVIFAGNIKQVRMGRENGVETYIDIAAGDGDDAYNYAVVNTTLAAGASHTDAMPKGALELVSDYGSAGFGGACPPPGEVHRYIFTVHALKTEKLDIPANASNALAGYMINANALAKASITAVFKR